MHSDETQTIDPQFANAAEGTGFPGVFPGGLTVGYMNVGAVQTEETASTGSRKVILFSGGR